MRAGLLILLPLIAATPACKREPTFDERYAATQKRIEAKSQRIDAELAGRPAQPNSTGQPANPTPAP